MLNKVDGMGIQYSRKTNLCMSATGYSQRLLLLLYCERNAELTFSCLFRVYGAGGANCDEKRKNNNHRTRKINWSREAQRASTKPFRSAFHNFASCFLVHSAAFKVSLFSLLWASISNVCTAGRCKCCLTLLPSREAKSPATPTPPFTTLS